MAENKTKPNEKSIDDFLNQIDDDKKREDSITILNLLQKITKEKPVMWGDSLIGFGTYHYKYASGREGDYFLTGFSPRKQNLTIYIMPGLERYPELTEKLGKYKTGKSCLYINKLEDIDLVVLKKLIKQSIADMKKAYK